MVPVKVAREVSLKITKRLISQLCDKGFKKGKKKRRVIYLLIMRLHLIVTTLINLLGCSLIHNRKSMQWL